MTVSGSGNVLAACEMPSSRKLKCRAEKVMTVVNFEPTSRMGAEIVKWKMENTLQFEFAI